MSKALTIFFILLFSHTIYGFELLKPYKNQFDAGVTYFDRTTNNNAIMLHVGLSRTSKWNPIYYGFTFSGNLTVRYRDYPGFGTYKTTNTNSLLAFNLGVRIAKKKRFSFTLGLSVLRFYTSSSYKSSNATLQGLLENYAYSKIILSPYLRSDFKINKKYSAFISDQFFVLFDDKLYNFTHIGISYNL